MLLLLLLLLIFSFISLGLLGKLGSVNFPSAFMYVSLESGQSKIYTGLK